MNKITVVRGQSLIDVAIQNYGTIEAVLVLALNNGLGITDALAVGESLIKPDFENDVAEVAHYYATKEILPSTDVTEAEVLLLENNDPCNLCKCFT